ncbi:MAG: S8 family serine peptidase [Wenzhouxiangellaceae bacterium]
MKNSCKVGAALAAALLLNTAWADDNRWIVQFAPGQAADGKASVQAAGGRIELDLTHRDVNIVSVTMPEAAIRGLENNPNVVLIEPDSRIYPMAETVPFGIDMVQAPLVSDEFAGNRKVCVIDSGYHAGHFDLQSTGVTGNPDSGSGDPFIDSCGHGTHVTGTIAALDNGDGIIGVLPGGNVNLHIVKVFGNDDWTSGACGWSFSSNLVAAALDCADAGADVINMSLGGGGFSSVAAQTFQDLLDANILPIAAAGNDGNTAFSYPASYDAVISVAAIDENKNLASFSQRNSQVELAAPGVNTLSTVPFVDANVTVDRDYSVSVIDGSAQTTASGDLVDGGLCDSAGSFSGRTVLCERGAISFADKVANVEAGGGAAAIIYNNEPGGFQGTLGCRGPAGRTCSTAPAVSMSQEDGQFLVANLLGAPATVATVFSAPADGYASWQGTSMATPHVAGVAALIWSHNPNWTAVQIREAMAATAEDLGDPGRDNSFGWGLVQAAAALDFLGGSSGGGDPQPDPEPEPNQPPTASFTYACDELACSFDGSASSDSDGSIAGHAWTFGDGNSAGGATVNHTYANDGSYTVTLTVTDNEGATGSTSSLVTVAANPPDDGNAISLEANGYKNRGRWTTDLSWSGATTSNVDIHRDGSVLTTVANTGAYTDATDFRGGGSLTYQVCEAGSSDCSETVTVNF